MAAVDETTQPVDETPVDDQEPDETDVDETDVDDDDDQELDDPEAHTHEGVDTERLMEERGKKQDKLEKYVTGKLVDIFGEDVNELVPCELCTWTRTFGYRVNTMLPPEPVRDAVKRAIGLGTIDELETFDGFAACGTCKGHGHVRTGSLVTAHMTRACPSCGGRGYSSTIAADATMQPVEPSVAALANDRGDGTPAVEPDFDMFGTPRGHPDYGKLAQYREVPIAEWAHNLPAGA